MSHESVTKPVMRFSWAQVRGFSRDSSLWSAWKPRPPAWRRVVLALTRSGPTIPSTIRSSIRSHRDQWISAITEAASTEFGERTSSRLI